MNRGRDKGGEIWRRIKSGWKAAFISIKDVLKVKLDKNLRANLSIQTDFPAMLYASKIWSITKKGYVTECIWKDPCL